MNIKITGSGSYIPNRKVHNTDFAAHQFLDEEGTPLPYPNDVVAEKFKQITGIEERRYAEDDLVTSDIAYFAAQKAIED
jgi:3-oxoacyl-[acyl-carrier-protein] synthase-3